MTQATLMIKGLGPVEINTERSEVILVGALTVTGGLVRCRTKKVSRNQKAAKQARQTEGAWLREIKPGYFMLIEE